jgi:hypothetical protein
MVSSKVPQRFESNSLDLLNASSIPYIVNQFLRNDISWISNAVNQNQHLEIHFFHLELHIAIEVFIIYTFEAIIFLNFNILLKYKI